MAMSISKTTIIDDSYPAGGSMQTVYFNPLSAIEEYAYADGSYSLGEGESFSGSRFLAAGDPRYYPESWPYGVAQSASIQIPHAPFVINSLRFPFDSGNTEQALVTLSSGNLTYHDETITWILSTTEPDPADIYLGGYRPDLGKWNYATREYNELPSGFGVMGLAAIVNESGTLKPRVIATSIVGSSFSGGAVDITNAIKAAKRWSGGKCFGFEWFLLPGDGSLIDLADEGSLSALKSALTSSSSNAITNDPAHQTYSGAATCQWITYSGFSWQSGRVKINAHTLDANSMIPPVYPRFD